MGRWELNHFFFLFCIIQYLSFGDAVDSTRCDIPDDNSHQLKGFNITAISNDKDGRAASCSWNPCPILAAEVSTKYPLKIHVYEYRKTGCDCQISSIEVRDSQTSKFWICTDIKLTTQPTFTSFPCEFDANCPSTGDQMIAVDSVRCEVADRNLKSKGFNITAILNKTQDEIKGKTLCPWTQCPEFTTLIKTKKPEKIEVAAHFEKNCFRQIISIEIRHRSPSSLQKITSIEIRVPNSLKSWNCSDIENNNQTKIEANCTSTSDQMKALCYSGWINVNGSCYRIINRKTDIHEAINNCYDDLIMETEITEELRNQIGYDENVWIYKNGSIQACNLGNLSCTTSGIHNSLCSMAMLNDSVNLEEPVRFFEAPWMIPNTKKSLDIIKKQYSISSPKDGMWIGLYKSGDQLFWIDNSFVSETEKRFLNISDSLSDGECAMYKGSVILTDCSVRKRGLTLPLLSVPCCSYAPPPRRDESEFKKSLKEITVKKKETSKYKRSKTSAPDERTSSKAIATVAALVIGIPFAAIVISDIPILTYQFREFCRNVRRRFKRTED